MEAFTWGAGGARMTPEQIAAQKKVAQALMEKGMDYSPIQSPWQGAARVAQALYGGLESGMADKAAAENDKANREMIASLLNGGGASLPPVSSSSPASDMPAPTSMRPSTNEKIYSANEPSPLDPPSGQDRDMAIRTVYGEDPGESALAVANVIRNRAASGKFGGDTIPGVVLAKNQFEPWNDPAARARMASLQPGSPEYERLGKIVDSAYTGANDPTGGATHFFAPKAQAALGRDVPAWGTGQGQDIGPHRFFGGTQTAQADDAIPSVARPTQATSTNRVAQSSVPGINPRVIEAVTSPYSSDATKKIAGILLQQQLKQSDYDIQQRPDGTVIAVNKKNPQDMKVLDAPGAGQSAIEFEARKAAAVAKAKGEAEKSVGQEQRDKEQKQVADVVTQDIDRAISLIDKSPVTTTGLVGPLLGQVGGTAANDVRALVDTVKANAGFAELQKMRNNSPTGGALGQVSEREIAYLQATIGNLEQSQTSGQFKDNLRRVKNTYMDIIHGQGKGPEREKLSFQENAKIRKFNPATGKIE